MENFRNGFFSALLCTDVLSRGIDIPEVDIVINYDLPVKSDSTGWKEPDAATYQHRVGRTGRFNSDGVSVTLYQGDSEESMIKKIEKYWDNEMEEITNFNQFLDIFF
jgi:ATP-dependent RNA helicase DDX19/DBP5